MRSGLLTQTAAFLEEWLPGGWRVEVLNSDQFAGVTMYCTITEKQVAAARTDPGAFLDSLAPDRARVKQALENRRTVRLVGPYASKAILRRRAGL